MNKVLNALLTGRKQFGPEVEEFLRKETERTGMDREHIIGAALILSKKKLRHINSAGDGTGAIGAFSETMLLEHEEKASLNKLLRALRSAGNPPA